MNETCSLGDLGVVPNGTIQLQLQSADPVNHPLQLIRPRQEYLMPDVITVRIHIGLFLLHNVIGETTEYGFGWFRDEIFLEIV